MLYGIVSNDPFELFDRGYGYNPWTGFSRYRQPFAGYHHPQSARRFMRTPGPTSFWDIPVQTEESEDIERRTRNDLTTQSTQSRGKCRKCRPKTTQVHDRRDNRLRIQDDSTAFPHADPIEIPVTKKERSKTTEESNTNGFSQKRKACRRNRRNEREEVPTSVCQFSELKLQDPHEEEEKNQKPIDNTAKEIPRKDEEILNKEENVPQSATTVEMVTSENADSEETHQPEAEMKAEEDIEESNRGDEEEGEDEPEKESTKDDEVKKKLEVIKVQLQTARELVPVEVLSAPRTDKQRVYLTEMLLRCILHLDMIETEGNEMVRMSRKEAVREIQSYLNQIENN